MLALLKETRTPAVYYGTLMFAGNLLVFFAINVVALLIR